MRNFKPLAIFCDCTVRLVWDLVENPEDRFSHNEAQVKTMSRLKQLVATPSDPMSVQQRNLKSEAK